MLERLGGADARTISTPKRSVLETLSLIKQHVPEPVFAEFGVGVGATTLEVAKILNNDGELHIFDFDDSVHELHRDLFELGYTNVVPHGNTEKYWDSYHWNVAQMLRAGDHERFDLIYIDGAHTYLHDALLFFMADRLLKVRGFLIFDDWNWSYSISQYMKDVRHNYMTEDQIESNQIGFLLETLVETHLAYETVRPKEVYRKLLSTSRPVPKR